MLGSCCTSIPRVEKDEEYSAKPVTHTTFPAGQHLLLSALCKVTVLWFDTWLLMPEGKGMRRHCLKGQVAPQKKPQIYFTGKGRSGCAGETLNPEAGGR